MSSSASTAGSRIATPGHSTRVPRHRHRSRGTPSSSSRLSAHDELPVVCANGLQDGESGSTTATGLRLLPGPNTDCSEPSGPRSCTPNTANSSISDVGSNGSIIHSTSNGLTSNGDSRIPEANGGSSSSSTFTERKQVFNSQSSRLVPNKNSLKTKHPS